MTNHLNTDSTTPKTEVLPFASGELDRSGLRLTRAEFSRFLGVSKQAVGEWVTAGKITLGTDGRLDPRQAVSQLMRNTDPARLRSKVLQPLVKEVSSLQLRITDLENQLATSKSDAEFHEEAGQELCAQQDRLLECLQNERDELTKQPSGAVIDGIVAWLGEVCFSGKTALALSITECIPAGAHFEMVEGAESSQPTDAEDGTNHE